MREKALDRMADAHIAQQEGQARIGQTQQTVVAKKLKERGLPDQDWQTLVAKHGGKANQAYLRAVERASAEGMDTFWDEVLGDKPQGQATTRRQAETGENFKPIKGGLKWTPSEKAQEIAKKNTGNDDVIETMLDEALRGMVAIWGSAMTPSLFRMTI